MLKFIILIFFLILSEKCSSLRAEICVFMMTRLTVFSVGGGKNLRFHASLENTFYSFNAEITILGYSYVIRLIILLLDLC